MTSASELTKTLAAVSDHPHVELLVAQSAGPAGRPLLVIHGGPDWDHTYLRDPLARLGDRYRLIMPDIRGCGRSTAGLAVENYTPDAAVADFEALMRVLNVEMVDLLGFSYGGLLAQRLALRAPRLVRKLIIASSSIYPVPADAYADWPERLIREAARRAAWADTTLHGTELVRAAAIAGASADVWREDKLPGYLHRLEDVCFGAEWMGPWRAGILPDARPPAAEAGLAKLGIPVLLLHGAQDTTFPAQLAAKAANRVPGPRAVIIERAGHMAHVDDADRWIEAVEDFLTE